MLLVNRLGNITFYYTLYRISDDLLIQRNKKVSAAPWPFHSSELVNCLKSYTIYIMNCCWISWTLIFCIVNIFLSKTCSNCATISCFVINKALGMVGWCLLWQKSQSGWDTVNLSQLYLNCLLFFKCVKRQVHLFCQLKNNYNILPTSISDKELKHSAYGRNRVSWPMQIEARYKKTKQKKQKTYEHFLPKIFF